MTHHLIDSLAPGKFEWNFRHVIFKQILVIDGWDISCGIALIWMSPDFTDDQSTLVQVMAWCRPTSSHYLSQCWPRSLLPHGVTRPQWVKIISGYSLKYISNGISCEGKDHEFYSYILKQKCCIFWWNSCHWLILEHPLCHHQNQWNLHIDIIKWKHFLRYWPFMWGIHWSLMNSPHQGQWCGALMFSLICVWINSWENNHEAGDLRGYHAHYDVIVMGGKHVVRITYPIDITVTLQWAPWWLKSQRLDYFHSHFFRLTSKKTSKLHVTGLCEGNPLMTGGFSSQMASNG